MEALCNYPVPNEINIPWHFPQMAGRHTWMETISLEVNEGCNWREHEVGRVSHIQAPEGGERDLDFVKVGKY